MEIKCPESSYVRPPHKVEGPMRKAREDFYELAKSKMRYMRSEEFNQWVYEMIGDRCDKKIGAGFGPFFFRIKKDGNRVIEKLVGNLEIGINIDAFVIDGESYEDLIPFVVEHELYEAWMNAKKGLLEGAFDQGGLNKKHYLAERREFLLAEKAGLGKKLFKWRMKTYPDNELEYRSAWESAKKKVFIQGFRENQENRVIIFRVEDVNGKGPFDGGDIPQNKMHDYVARSENTRDIEVATEFQDWATSENLRGGSILFGFTDAKFIERYFSQEFITAFVGEGKKYRVVAYSVATNIDKQKTLVVSSKTGEAAFLESSAKRIE